MFFDADGLLPAIIVKSSDRFNILSDIIISEFGNRNFVGFLTSSLSTNKNVTSFNDSICFGVDVKPTKNGTGANKKFHKRLGKHGTKVACHSNGVNNAVNAHATAYDIAGSDETMATDFSINNVDKICIIFYERSMTSGVMFGLLVTMTSPRLFHCIR